jgi:hypothetical protein
MMDFLGSAYVVRVMCVTLMAWTAIGSVHIALAQQEKEPLEDAGTSTGTQFSGPSSVGGQLKSDGTETKSAFRLEGFSRSLTPYYDFKARVKDSAGLDFGADYNVLYQYTGQSPGEHEAAGGVFRFFGTWTLLNRGAAKEGALTYKIENRHDLGNECPRSVHGGTVLSAAAVPAHDDHPGRPVHCQSRARLAGRQGMGSGPACSHRLLSGAHHEEFIGRFPRIIKGQTTLCRGSGREENVVCPSLLIISLERKPSKTVLG